MIVAKILSVILPSGDLDPVLCVRLEPSHGPLVAVYDAITRAARSSLKESASKASDKQHKAGIVAGLRIALELTENISGKLTADSEPLLLAAFIAGKKTSRRDSVPVAVLSSPASKLTAEDLVRIESTVSRDWESLPSGSAVLIPELAST